MPQYCKYFRNLYPISSYPQYSSELEFSDKIILPKSVLQDLRRLQIPHPLLFILKPERSMQSSVYCAPLEFRSEEENIYLPIFLYKKLGFKVLKHEKVLNKSFKTGYGVYLQSLPLRVVDPNAFSSSLCYTIPKCQKMKAFISRVLSIEKIRRGLLNYSVIKEGEDIRVRDIQIANGKEIVYIYILKLIPADICILADMLFEIEIVDHLPKQSYSLNNTVHLMPEKKKNNLGILDIPERSAKLPKFLIEIMHNRVGTSSTSRKREKSPNPYLIYDSPREDSDRASTALKTRFNHTRAISMDNDMPLSIATAPM